MILLVAAAAVLCGAMVSSATWAAGGRSRAAHLAVGVGHFAALALSTLLTFGFGLISGMRCDEGCAETGPWRYHRDAWQWDAVGLLGVAGLALTIAAVVLTARRRVAQSWLALIAPALCYLAGWALYASGSA